MPTEYLLSRAEMEVILENAKKSISVHGRDIDSPRSLAEFRSVSANLPHSLIEFLAHFREYSGAASSTIIRRLPIDADSLPETPNQPGSTQRTRAIPAIILMMIASRLGKAVAYQEEKGGALVQNVVPISGEERVQGNVGSSPLALHTEYPFYISRPDVVLLLCLRPDRTRRGRLLISSTRKALSFLDSDTIQDLFRPEFEFAPPASFRDHASKLRHGVLSGLAEDPFLRINIAGTQALTARARVALSSLHSAMNRAVESVHLSIGDLAIIDNRFAAHGRTGFVPRYDGKDRWLQRTFVALDK